MREEMRDSLRYSEPKQQKVTPTSNVFFVAMSSSSLGEESPTEVIGFGANYFHQMGSTTSRTILKHNEESNVDAYTFSEKPPWEEDEDDYVVQIACTSTSTLFLTKKSGKIYKCGTLHGSIWPSLTRNIIQLPLKCVEIAAGRHYGLARMEGGLAVCSWGAGHFGQLGLGSESSPCIEHPTVIEGLLPHVVGSPIAAIAAGYWHAMAVTQSGHLYSWGCNRNAQCGKKPSKDPPTICSPQMVGFEDARAPKITKIAAGRSHSVALTANGTVYCWGACQYGQCGILSRRRGGVAPPKRVETLEQVQIVDISAGDSHTLALTGGGRVFGWGSGFEGQLGSGSIVSMNSKPKLIGDLDFVAIQAGQEWKTQQKQRQDHNTTIKEAPSPKSHALSNIPKIVSIYATGNCSMAISSSGHVYAWGCNDVGNLGVPKIDPDRLPFVEPGLPLPKTSTLRQLHTQSFDSSHNVNLPLRLDALKHLNVSSVAASPTFLWCLGTKRSADQTSVVGRTLYEVQEARRQNSLRSRNIPPIAVVDTTNFEAAASDYLPPPMDPPETKDGSAINLEGEGSLEQGTTSAQFSPINATISQKSSSPSNRKKKFSLKKMAKGLVKRTSNGSLK